MAHLVGSCWEGNFSDGKSTDIQCFTEVFGGQFVRSVHRVEGERGPYGGESIFTWDADNDRLRYVYWDTSGGMSEGTLSPTDDGWQADDETYTAPDGSVRAISNQWRVTSDDSWSQIVSIMSAEGTVPLWTITYVRTPLKEITQ
jgi:hypothetical protein